MLNEVEAGSKVAELCRKHGIPVATYYNWKAKFGGMTVSDAQRLNRGKFVWADALRGQPHRGRQ